MPASSMDPEHLQGERHNAAYDDDRVYRGDSLIRPEKLFTDKHRSFVHLVPVSEVWSEVVSKEVLQEAYSKEGIPGITCLVKFPIPSKGYLGGYTLSPVISHNLFKPFCTT
jgi:hypothetical protein